MRTLTIYRRARLLLCAIALAGCSVAAALAHSGRLAMAAVVDDIRVDGDLSDWPEHLPRYPITNAAYGEAPRDGADLAAEFRVAYSHVLDRLYVAIEVTDQSLVLPETRTDWTGADGCELYVDATHGGGGPVQLSRWGRFDAVPGFPLLPRDAAFPLPGGYAVATGTSGVRRTYEWSVDMSALAGNVRLEPGVDLGFDVVVIDRDDDGSFTWMSWGPNTSKLQDPSRLGDLIAVGGGETLGEALAATDDLLGSLVGRTVERVEDTARRTAGFFAFLAGALLAVSLLHLLLFVFQRGARVNLYYALFAGVTVVAIALAYVLPSSSLEGPLIEGIVSLWVVVANAASLLLLYGQFRGGLTRTGKVLLAGLVFAGLVHLDRLRTPLSSSLPGLPGVPVDAIAFGPLVTLAAVALSASLAAIAVLVVGAVLRRREGAWSVGVSFLVFALCGALSAARLALGQVPNPMLLVGILLPLGAMSYRLARSVGRAHDDLRRRYSEVESLSAQLREQNRELELANIKIRQQSRQVAEANRLKSDFLARMSHDLRTPLNAIIGYTRILLRRLHGTVDERQYRNLENIRISADNLLALINDILDLSRIESGRLEVRAEDVDVAQLAAECAAAIDSLVPAGVELRADLPESLVVRTDADRLRRVLMNLMGNAVKYTEAGHITVGAQREGDAVVLSVVDTGVGIPAEDLPHVFDEFRQVDRKDKRREGSGLGLAIARRSVELLGGTIAARSTVGEGSTFIVRLPLTPPPALEAAVPT